MIAPEYPSGCNIKNWLGIRFRRKKWQYILYTVLGSADYITVVKLFIIAKTPNQWRKKSINETQTHQGCASNKMLRPIYVVEFCNIQIYNLYIC